MKEHGHEWCWLLPHLAVAIVTSPAPHIAMTDEFHLVETQHKRSANQPLSWPTPAARRLQDQNNWRLHFLLRTTGKPSSLMSTIFCTNPREFSTDNAQRSFASMCFASVCPQYGTVYHQPCATAVCLWTLSTTENKSASLRRLLATTSITRRQ